MNKAKAITVTSIIMALLAAMLYFACCLQPKLTLIVLGIIAIPGFIALGYCLYTWIGGKSDIVYCELIDEQ